MIESWLSTPFRQPDPTIDRTLKDGTWQTIHPLANHSIGDIMDIVTNAKRDGRTLHPSMFTEYEWQIIQDLST